ncbi:MAG: MFS transporter [Bdellovibrionaceae bacterium]|nr:MFS transporter [Pseudobdellovibrionaceae bacterium]
MESSQRKKALFIIFITVFIDLVGFGIIIPLSPYLSREFGASALQIGLLMAIYSLMQFVFSPFWGQLSDRFGRRPIILMSVFVAGVSHLAFAFSTEFWMLFVARTFAGIGGANISTAMAYMADISSKKDRSKTMGLIGAAFGLGFVFGPFIGGIFGEVGSSLGSAAPFGKSFSAVIASSICLLNFIFAFFYLKESRQVNAEVTAIKLSKRIKVMFFHLKKETVGSLMFLLFMTTFAMAHMEATLFLYVSDVFHLGMKEASFGFAYVGVVMAFTQGYLIRKWLPKFGERSLLVWGALMAGIGFLMIAMAPNVLSLGVAVTFLAIGIGLVNPSLHGGVSLLSSSDLQGEVMGVNQSLSALARIIGPATGGFIYDQVSLRSPFFIAAGFMGLVFFLSMKIYSKIPNSAKTE